MPIDTITQLIYDAIIDDSATCCLAEAIAKHMRADTNWILIGVNAETPPAATCIHGIPQDIARAYEETYHRYDPWLSVIDRIPEDTPFSLDNLVTIHQFQGSRVYQELIRGKVDVLHCMGLVFRNRGSQSTFALQRGKRGPAFDDGDEKRLKPYTEHLKRYITATIRKTTVLPHDLDTLVAHPDPVIIVDKNAYPVHCSSVGAALMDLGAVIARTASGRLYSVDRIMPLETSVRLAAFRSVPTVQHVYPPCGAHIIAVDPCPSLAHHAIITIRNLEDHVRRKVNDVARRFPITEAERRLITSLVTGLTLEEHCLSHGVAISTARSQLHSIFNKTGTQRQSKLITMVLLPPTHIEDL